MKIGIIGPSKIESLENINKQYEMILLDLARKIANSGKEIIGVPDNGSVSEFFMKSYKDLGGKNVEVLVPLDDKEFGFDWVNVKLGENINCGMWRNQPEKLNEECDVLLCLGYSVGVLAEIAYSKWFKPKPVYIIRELISEKLPEEIKNGVDLRYISFNDIGDLVG
jgi:hypothetical protein